ncbi:hypothetical protein BD779DRAFT_529768 [Infundibulicybe gibba]|nr:hypothetical protein BD779DRAFT_529768 [Infundibulicybe gibba]
MSRNSNSLAMPNVTEAKTAQPMHFRPIMRNHFFFATGILGLLGWIVALASQAVVTANIGNGPVGSLWFAILVQAYVIFWIIYSLAGGTVAMHRIQISVFAGVALVLGVEGVNRNIFSSVNSQQALAAGWLVSAIVDILWIVYFTSEENSRVRAIGQIPDPVQPPTRPVSAYSTYPPSNTSVLRDSQAGARLSANVNPAAVARNTAGRGGASGIQRASGTTPAISPSPAAGPASAVTASMASNPSNPPPQAAADNSGATTAVSGRSALGSVAIHQAEGLFDYKHQDPGELSFSKGEVLESWRNPGNGGKLRNPMVLVELSLPTICEFFEYHSLYIGDV